MKYFLKTTFTLLFVALIALGCEDSFNSLVDERLEDNPVPDQSVPGESGSADFSNYVAIGNSLTAGFMDAALYNDGQDRSLAAIMAGQFAFAGGPETFNQPDINSERGFNTSVQQPQGSVLGRFKLDTSIPGPSPTIGGDAIAPYTGDVTALNNFGVPGIVVGQLLTSDTGNPQSQAYNPFYARFASDPGNSTILGDALATQPTFFSLWIGNNDVLGYAISGASDESLLTDENAFDNQFNAVVDQLMDNSSASGVVGTIPPVTLVPYFQAVTWDNITLDASTAQQLNAALQGVNDALDGVAQFPDHDQEEVDQRKINYAEGSNPILVRDPSLEDYEDEYDQLEALGEINSQERAALVPYEQSRPLTQGELVTLSAGSLLGTEANPGGETPTTIGVVIPLGFNLQNPEESSGDEFFLTADEQSTIQSRTNEFNTIIATRVAQEAQSNGRLALFDINSGFPGNPNTELGAFADLFGIDGELGIRIEGQLLQPDFSPNGVFSTDGLHPNQRGNAILANEFIEVIESNFGAEIPTFDVLDLPSVQTCSGDCVSDQQQSKPLVWKK